jgi:acyl carrier protein
MIFERLKKLIVEHMGCEDDEITLETTSDDLGMDSLDMAEFVMSVEDEFDIDVTDDEALSWGTVGGVVEYIREHT